MTLGFIWDDYNPAFRKVRINGTSQPLWFYGYNQEVGNSDMETEAVGASNVRFLGMKREGSNPVLVLSNCVNVAAYGFGYAISAPTDDGYYQVLGTSTNILLANLTVFKASSPSTLTNNILYEAITGQPATNILWPNMVSLYKRGEINDALMLTTPTLSTNAFLKGLVLSPAGVLSPGFTTNDFSYIATNAYGSTPTLTVTNADATATNRYSLNGGAFTALTNSVPSGALTLGVGSTNLLKVVVTAQDGLKTNLYTVNLTMLPNTNALLSNLTLSTGGLTPSPFAPGTPNYAATNAYVSNPVTVTATSADANATMQLKLNGSGFTSLTSSVASGSQTLVLNPPLNTLAVKVTAQDGVTTNLYTLNVLLQPSVTAFTLTNSVSGGTNLVLNWPLDHTGYRLLTQTNNLNKGISGNTVDWGTVASYAASNTAVIPILTTNLNQYFRLVYP
jgi:hypothetical protein